MTGRYTFTAATESGIYTSDVLEELVLWGGVLMVREQESSGWHTGGVTYTSTSHCISKEEGGSLAYYRGTKTECEVEIVKVIAAAATKVTKTEKEKDHV